MLAEASCHRCPACCVFVDELLEVLLASDFHLLDLDDQVCTKHPSSNPSAVSAVAEMSPSMTGKQFRVVDLDHDGTAQTVSFHCGYQRIMGLGI